MTDQESSTPPDENSSSTFPPDSDRGAEGLSTSGEKPTGVRWRMFALACLTSWFFYLHRYTWNFIGPGLGEDFGWTRIKWGALATFFTPAYGAGQIPSGILCDWIGPHFFLGAIIALWSLVLPMHGLPLGYYGLGGIRLLFGAAQAGGYPALSKVTYAWFPLSSRTMIQGWVATFFGRSGAAMSSIIMGAFLMGICGFTWREAILILGVLGLIFAVVFLVFFRNSPEQSPGTNQAERDLINEGRSPAAEGGGKMLPWGRALKNRSMVFFVIQQITSAGADMVYLVYMGDYFLNSKQIDITQAGFLVSLPLFGGAIGGMLGGYCNDLLIRYTGNRRWSRCAVGFTGKLLASVLLFVTIRQESAFGAALSLFMVKFFSDWSQPTVWGACTDIGRRYSATIFGIINTSGSIGGFFSLIFFGWIIDQNTSIQLIEGVEKAIPNYNPLFVTVAVMYLISAFAWFFIDCSKPIEEEAVEGRAA